MLKEINYNRVKKILSKHIFNRDDFNQLTEEITGFLKNSNFDKMKNYLKLIENEMIIPVNNDGAFTINDYLSENTNLSNLFFTGILPLKKETMIENHNYFLYYETDKYKGYNSIENIREEIYNIFNEIDIENILKTFLINLGNITKNETFDTINDESNIKVLLIAEEFLNINNHRAEMFSNKNAIIYSNLLNYSRLDMLRARIIKKKSV